ncbi:MAG: type I secretion system permease/ATPase, partial [Rhizobiales bacterium]|nr:type I secretion system permease/ATPase [Hyphomicrobiales bacterium]
SAGQAGADSNARFTSLSRALRLILQSAILGIGAYLVISNELSPGALIAASIIFARALAPVDMAVAQWRGIVAAYQSWGRLRSAVL